MKSSRILIIIGIILLAVLVMVVAEALGFFGNSTGKAESQNGDNGKDRLSLSQSIVRAFFRIVTGVAIIKVIKGFFFPSRSKPDEPDEGGSRHPSAPPLSHYNCQNRSSAPSCHPPSYDEVCHQPPPYSIMKSPTIHP
ncbi:hypothetical protein [Encephalitozoon cuniculi GB-M1]|uniref:Uncharacterized protein n=1 Tax=Encephalitozoon cuniculi (strain GB-M1) TaxID=284813 RepID=Q8SUU6_ENCCU|nr:uncharacterized protein ECU07_1770 [Encephalitozoon cuniculi GB-M1]CAD25708.2 hypothetical protein [Encephalitozoon cuniculi GB-M1]